MNEKTDSKGLSAVEGVPVLAQTPQWRVRREYLWGCWDNDAVIYNVDSGATHHLIGVTSRFLACCCSKEPVDLDMLSDTLKDLYADWLEDQLKEYVIGIMAELVNQELVEPIYCES